MKSIWKFPIEIADEQNILMPKGADILSVQTQNESPCIWALVDIEEEREERTFFVYGTGHPCCHQASEFVGTFQTLGGSLIFHLFEKKK